MIKEEIDLLLATNKGPAYHKCKAAHAIDQFKDEDRDAISRLLDSSVTAPIVVEYLASHGITIKADAVSKHRRRSKGNGCSCEVSA